MLEKDAPDTGAWALVGRELANDLRIQGIHVMKVDEHEVEKQIRKLARIENVKVGLAALSHFVPPLAVLEHLVSRQVLLLRDRA
jgi:hypothetical protein